jgi:4-carboxymuconolactone decarboxylase
VTGTPDHIDAYQASYDRGMAVRRAVLGDAHVDRAMAGVTALDADFQRWITESAWGGVWARPGLDRRTRSMVTIAILGALRSDELELHLKAARNTGVTEEELTEVLMHVGVYAGVPAANSAFRTAKQVARELGDLPSTPSTPATASTPSAKDHSES